VSAGGGGAQRPARQWPAWIDDVLAYGPLAELEDEWRAAVGDAITRVLDLRQGSREVTCACCGATRIVAASSGGAS
jgi:LSD1 subclass zinc finger protein